MNEEGRAMRVALYARYSSEGQREASIEDQYRNCERYATREGWQITARYQDKGISGTRDETARDGYRAMIEAAKAKQFEALLVDDLSRLSRDSMKTEEVRRLFVFLQVRIVSVSDGIDTASKGSKALTGFKGLMADIFLDDLKEKTHRGLAGQALKGFNTGGRLYGYRHVPIYDPTEKDEYGRPKIMAARREIDEDQAKWMRCIFEWYAEGRSPRDIADELNQRGVPAPGAAYKRKNRRRHYGTWSATVLHGDINHATGMLNNPVYIGKVIWNRREWVVNPETKKRVPRIRPESEWIITEQPELRIIPQELWDRVQERRKAVALGQIQNGHVRTGRGPKFLLSGLLVCDECESHFVVADYYRYACGGHINRGPSVCKNSLRVARKLVEDRCLTALRNEMLSPENVEAIIKKTTRLLTEYTRNRQPEHERAQCELAKVEREIENIMRAIKAGVLTPTTSRN
jgi:site-specific DNA recombinase